MSKLTCRERTRNRINSLCYRLNPSMKKIDLSTQIKLIAKICRQNKYDIDCPGILYGFYHKLNDEALFKIISENTKESLIKSYRRSGKKSERTCAEYGTDIIIGWIGENAVTCMLKKSKILAHLSGCDSDRKFQIKLNNKPDIEINGSKVRLEIKNGFTNWWRDREIIDLKGECKKGILKYNSIVLGVDWVNKKFCLMDLRDGREIGNPEEKDSYDDKKTYPVYVDYRKEFVDRKNFLDQLQILVNNGE